MLLHRLQISIPAIVVILLSLTLVGHAQGPTLDWAVRTGAAGASSIGESVDVDAGGNVYTSGRFTGTVDFDPGAGSANLTSAGSEDAFITKMDPSGNLIWAKRVGGTQGDYSFGNAVDATGNVYLTGSFAGTVDFDPGPGVFNLTAPGVFIDDIFILKLDPDGNFLWAKRIGSSGLDFGHSIAVGPSGVVTTGSFEGTVDFDPGTGTASLAAPAGQDEIFILKLDASGNYVWAKRMGGTSGDFGRSIALDASESVYSTGFFRGTADFDPGPATFNLTDAGNSDIFVSKLDASGNFVWAKRMGGANSDRGASINVDLAGNVYTTGDFHGTADFDPGAGTSNLVSAGFNDSFVSKLDASGNFIWVKRIGGDNDDEGTSLSLDGAGNVYCAGLFQSSTIDLDPGPGTFNVTPVGSGDVFITKLDPSGNFVWGVTFGATTIHVNVVGGIYTTGYFSNTVDFDPGAGVSNLTAAGTRDIFVSKLNQAPVPPTVASFTPSSGPVGTSVTINGTNFSPEPVYNVVYFGATRAAVTSATANQLTVTVPFGATFDPITVTIAGSTAYSSKPFTVTFADGNVIQSCSFASRIDVTSSLVPYDVALGDLDGDGYSDMVTANFGSSTINVFMNRGIAGPFNSISFFPPVSFATFSIPYSVALGDIDGDGKLDILVTNFDFGRLSLYRNISSPGVINASSFEAPVHYLTAVNPYYMVVGDLDGDGKSDVALTAEASSAICIFRNTGAPGSFTAGTFDPRIDLTTPANPNGLAISDLDADGKPDLIATAYGNASAVVYRNISTPGSISGSSFEAPVSFTAGTDPKDVNVGDLDGDGKPDLTISNYTSNTISVLKNTSAGSITFAPKVDFATGASPWGVTTSDLDGDGKLDLGVVNQGSSTISVFKNTTTSGVIDASSFAPKVDFPTAAGPRPGAIGDIDRDGKPELLVPGAHLVSVLRNRVSSLPPPTLVSFSPTFGDNGDPITITGTNFSTSPLNNTVSFNGVFATVTGSTSTTITALVPAGASDGPITVTIGCNTVASGSNFNFQCDVPPSQKAALVALYNSTNGALWTNNNNWLTGNAVSWNGVVTDLSCNVVEIQLDFNNLDGPIPPEIGDLTELTHLSLSANQINGTLPSQITNLTNLEYMFINDNQITGPLPATMGNLTSLIGLGTQNNLFSGALPASMANCTELRNLNLDGNQHTGSIPSFLGTSLVNLQSLTLSRNHFDGVIPPELGNLGDLSLLSLSENDLYGEIPPELGDLDLLGVLDLSHNQLYGEIPVEIENCNNLYSLQLWDNQFYGEIPQEIGNLTNLMEINLSQNQLSGHIPGWGVLPSLQYVNLSNNNLDGDLPSSLGTHLAIEELYLNNNFLTDDIPQEIADLPALRIANFSHNAFDEMRPFTSSVLTDLAVENNSLDFSDLELNIGITNYTYDPQEKLPPGGIQGFTVGGPLFIPFATPGSGNLYQWYKDGAPVPGETSDNLTIASTTAANIGAYYVQVTSSVVPGITMESLPYTVYTDLCAPGPRTAGELDTSFNPPTDVSSSFYNPALQSDGKILVSTNFAVVNSTNMSGLLRFNSDGSFDNTFTTNDSDQRFVVQPNDKIIIGVDNGDMERLEADGTNDPSFTTPNYYNAYYSAMALQADGKVLVAVNEDGTPYLDRRNDDGTDDPTFSGPYIGDIDVIRLQTDGKILIGGQFVGGISRLEADGSIDGSFTGVAGDFVYDIALQADGKIVVVGMFSYFNNLPHRGVVRLNADGSIDNSFNSVGITDLIELGYFPNKVLVQPDGKIILGGLFESINGTGRNNLIRLNTDGSVDCDFDPEESTESPDIESERITGMILQPDDKILITGAFEEYDEVARFGLARVNGIVLSATSLIYYGRTDGTIWSTAGDGTADQFITNGNRPTISPDGNYLLFHKGPEANRSNQDIYVRDMNTTVETLIFNNNDFAVSYGWTANSAKIVFDYQCGIYTMNPDGTGMTSIQSADCFDDGPAVRASDGQVAFHNQTGIFTITSAGGGRTQVPNTVAGDYFPAWSPDGQWISFTRYIMPAGTFAGMYKIKPDGTGLTALTATLLPGETLGSVDGSPAMWTADGLAIVMPGVIDCRPGLFEVAVDGSGTIQRIESTFSGAGPDFAGGILGNPTLYYLPLRLIPSISSFAPTNGMVGTLVSIFASNISATASNNIVTFNGTPAVVTGVSTGVVFAVVPGGATTGPITVSRGCTPATSATNFVIDPLTRPACSIAQTFNGTTDYVEVPDQAALRPASVTVEAYIRLKAFPSGSKIGIVIKRTGTAAFDANWQLELLDQNDIRFSYFDGAIWQNNDTDTNPITNLNQWYHVAATYTPGEVKLYVDGALLKTFTGRPPIRTDYTGQVQLGRGFDGYLNADIDEVRVWNLARATEEIQLNINGSLSGAEPGLVAYYRLNNTTIGAGATVPNDAAITAASANGTTFGSATSPAYVYDGPLAPNSPVDGSSCGAGPVTLSVSGAAAGGFRWYTAPTGGTAIGGAINGTFVTPSLTVTTTYYATLNNGTCESLARTPVVATINTPPGAPSTTGASACLPTSLVISASGGVNGQYRWYTVSSGGTAIGGEVNDTYTTPVLTATTSYFVAINNGTCESSRTAVSATISSPPAPVITTSNCTALGATLTGPSGFTGYAWSNGATTPSINVTAAGSYTLIVTDAGGCSSPSSAAVSFTAAFCNQAPVINPPTVNATLQSTVDIVASDFITDLDNNLDLTTLSIVTQPISGAPASVDASFNIVVDYSDTPFAGTDALTIQVCDVLGACSQADVTIEVAGEITVFNALSPNADGKNDAFYIQYIDALPNTKANKVTIFDRNGNVVFSIDNYDNQSRVFTGLSNSGTELPPGTYYYKIDFMSGTYSKTGFVALRK